MSPRQQLRDEQTLSSGTTNEVSSPPSSGPFATRLVTAPSSFKHPMHRMQPGR
eukprot:CAMPEP_0182842450 /NCGR_PEP_ID=MMETSP0006_2-20121128/25630_1 /TAXON_ID=97485 /ORGANISM="Prymnesium parvum, Strain Texoma1" /LENGTH=52 /DNA_ID=CAMNT_0024972115 /DNA_START=102 /DNA_END=257 /DNA_ORIENTATION=+